MKRGLVAVAGLRWFFATIVVAACGVSLGLYVLRHPGFVVQTRYGEPVRVPAAEVVLACPQVPPTENRGAVDETGVPLNPPQIAGSVTAVVLSRNQKVPKNAVYSPLTAGGSSESSRAVTSNSRRQENLATGKQSGEADTNESPDVKSDLILHPKSAMLFGHFSQPVSGFLRAAPWQNQAALAAADIEQSVSSGDYRGLAVGSCQIASLDAWLVGGSTTPGNSTVLQLMNPSVNPVESKVDIWSESGKKPFPRGQSVKIPAQSLISLPLEAQLADVQSLVVHVKSTGAGVAAFLMTHTLQGMSAGGVSLVHTSAPPAKTQVVPGVALSEDLGSVRVLNPGSDVSHASIEVVNQKGRFPLPGGTKVSLDPQTVTDFTLGGLQPGNYAVVVHADTPVVAGALIYRHGGESDYESGQFVRDHAWLPAVEPGGGVLLAPQSINRQLLVTNLTGEAREYKVSGDTHVVNPGTTVVLPLEESAVSMVEAPDLYVTQVLTTELGDGLGIDALEPVPDMARSRQIYVHLHS